MKRMVVDGKSNILTIFSFSTCIQDTGSIFCKVRLDFGEVDLN